MGKKIGNKVYDFLLILDKSQVAILLFAEMIIGSILSIFSFLLFSKLAQEVLENDPIKFDNSIISFIYQFRSPLLTKIMFWISIMGNDLIILLGFIAIIILVWKKHKQETLLFSFILFMGAIINIIFKILIKRPRPDIAPLLIEQSYSFPSGHSMNSFIFYTAAAYFIFRFTRNKKISLLISTVCLILIILIGISRIYLGVHYPSDVIAGFIGGFWWFVSVIVIEKTIVFYKLFRVLKEDNP